jgi:hypothetical protein
MKFQANKAKVTMGEKTFVDETSVEMNWTEGNEGCLYVVPANIGWKKLLKAARDGKQAFKKHLNQKKVG